MIRLDPSCDRLPPAERFGLEVLLDSSRLLRAEAGVTQAVILGVHDDHAVVGATTDEPTLERSAGRVGVPRALLRSVTELAGCAIEQRASARDQHERVPPEHNPLVAAGRERVPIVSRWGRHLRRVVWAAAPPGGLRLLAPWPDGKRWAVAFTHDLDLVAWWPAATGLRVVELLRRGDWRRVGSIVGAAATGLAHDPVWSGVRHVLETQRRHAIAGTWFVICGSPTLRSLLAEDVTYRPESRATRRILAAVEGDGHEIGLHGSFATMLDAARFAAERARLTPLVGRPPDGVRQHFLRMRPGATQRAMAEAGFQYDASFGFSDRNGFRLGLADVAPGWDDAFERAVRLDQVPLMWMDRAMSKYAGEEDPDRWVDDALTLMQESRAVDGLWVGLWHPNLTTPLGFPGAPTAFERLVEEVLAGDPYVAPLSRLVAWRRARRGVRAVRVTPEGRVQLAAVEGWHGPLRLEDADARTVQEDPWPSAG